MIIIIVGGIGSGKSLTMIKELVSNSEKAEAYVNFRTKKIKGVHRMKMEYILNYAEDKKGNRKPVSINYDFWRDLRVKKKRFSIYLDEVHNIINSRASMSKNNQLLTTWLAQIRKVFGKSEKDHLYLISQKIGRIDVALRDLAHIIIECKKIKKGKKVYVLQKYYNSLENYDIGKSFGGKVFYGNKYFEYYDSYELIDFGNEVYL